MIIIIIIIIIIGSSRRHGRRQIKAQTQPLSLGNCLMLSDIRFATASTGVGYQVFSDLFREKMR
jgi:hypothetical protein